jgi:hypothetical protein
MKAIIATYTSCSGDEHAGEVAVFTPDHYGDMEIILDKLKKQGLEQPHFDVVDYTPILINPAIDDPAFDPIVKKSPQARKDGVRLSSEYGATTLEPPD